MATAMSANNKQQPTPTVALGFAALLGPYNEILREMRAKETVSDQIADLKHDIKHDIAGIKVAQSKDTIDLRL